MMYFELKSMLVKKFAQIYLFLCLCGNKEKFSRLEHDILIKEENEVLREKYVEILAQLQDLNTEGRLILNQKNLEKVALHLERGKVLRAAGVSRAEEKARVEKEKKVDRRAKRRYIT
jgi:hypothetical protein